MRKLSAALLMFGTSSAYAAEEAKGGMPQLDPASYPSQLFWLAVFFVLFYVFMDRVGMPRVHRTIDARRTRIEDDLNHAGEASGNAGALQHELETRLAQAREEARRLLAASGVEMTETARKREKDFAAELSKKIEAAEAEIAAAQNQAMQTVSEIAAGIIGAALPKLAPVAASASEIENALAKASSGAPLQEKAA